MRIAVVMTGGGAGGLQQVAVPYAEALRRAGHAVTLILAKGSPMQADAEALGLDVCLTRFGARWLRPLHVLELRKLFQRLAPDCVVAIAQKGLAPSLAAVRRQTPVISHCGGTRPEVIRKLLGADHLVVTSVEMRDLALAEGARPEALSIVPNFLLGAPVPHPEAPNRPLRIGTLGRLTKRKGFDLLIAAAARLDAPFELVIAGEGEEKAALAALGRDLGAAVRFPGWIGNDAKSAFLSGLDIFVCPSRFEPFGNVYLEAMQHALPIITTPTTGARAIFGAAGPAVILAGDDPAEMADAMTRMMADEAGRRRLGKAAQDLFAARFSIDAAGPLLADAALRATAAFPGAQKPV